LEWEGKEECLPLVVTQLPNALAPTTAALTALLFYFPDVTRHGMMCLGVAIIARALACVPRVGRKMRPTLRICSLIDSFILFSFRM